MFNSTQTRPRELGTIANLSESAFETCERIEPVAILYGRGARLFVTEHNIASRLLKDLHRLGRGKLTVRGMISTRGSLDRSSIRALNCWMEHYYGPRHPRCIGNGGLHRFDWYKLQATLALRWVR